MSINSNIKQHFDGFISSYSQVFFSDNKAYAYWLLVASFANWTSGVAGAVSVAISLAFSRWLGLDKALIRSGFYSYNALLLGLAMGLYYDYGAGFWLLLTVFSIFTVFATKGLSIFFQKYALPVLNLPFILTLWTMSLSIRNFQTIHISEKGLFKINELYATGGMAFVTVYEWITDISLPPLIDAYFKSLGAIYFQFSTIAGMVIAAGLFLYSRIAFTLSVLGFLTGYCFFWALNGAISPYSYSFVGFNYILAAISLGGFYVVPSRKSYILAVVAAMMIAILYAALASVFIKLQLPVYAFPCTATILLVLISLKYKPEANGLELVTIQNYSPEKNLYKHQYRSERYKNDTFIHIHPPFFGDWTVSQGHNGGITHLGDWQYAWDFVITDENKKTYRGMGYDLVDYYCYNVPILAPADGYVVQIVDTVDDNPVGGVDLAQNWGNTIVIKHTEGLFSKISHIKQGSYKVAVGDYVYRGQWLANCGNSGRSPEPHIHFQLQTTPYIGSKTLKYPLAYFMDFGFRTSDSESISPTSETSNPKLRSFDIAKENAVISGIQTTTLLTQAFQLTPGTIFHWEEEANDNGKISIQQLKWTVFTDAYNQTYIYCSETESSAYFVNNGTLIYFTDFVGNRESALYLFYLGCHKILLGYYDGLIVKDLLPISGIYKGVLKVIQDFVAPFFLFLKAEYQSSCTSIDDVNYPRAITLSMQAQVLLGKMIQKEMGFVMDIDEKGIECLVVVQNHKLLTLRRL